MNQKLLTVVILILTSATITNAGDLSDGLTSDNWRLNYSAQAYQLELDKPIQFTFANQPSPRSAVYYSLLGTLLPVTAGILVWALDGPEDITIQQPSGGTFTFSGPDPDRTLPALLIWGGATIGPSMGYFYGNKTRRGIGGIALRNGVLFVSLLAAVAICPPFSCNDDDDDIAGLVFFSGVGIALFSSIYDIATVEKAVINENAKREKKSLSVSPMFSNDFRPSGITLTLNF